MTDRDEAMCWADDPPPYWDGAFTGVTVDAGIVPRASEYTTVTADRCTLTGEPFQWGSGVDQLELTDCVLDELCLEGRNHTVELLRCNGTVSIAGYRVDLNACDVRDGYIEGRNDPDRRNATCIIEGGSLVAMWVDRFGTVRIRGCRLVGVRFRNCRIVADSFEGCTLIDVSFLGCTFGPDVRDVWVARGMVE